jgi:hypothetical protein
LGIQRLVIPVLDVRFVKQVDQQAGGVVPDPVVRENIEEGDDLVDVLVDPDPDLGLRFLVLLGVALDRGGGDLGVRVGVAVHLQTGLDQLVAIQPTSKLMDGASPGAAHPLQYRRVGASGQPDDAGQRQQGDADASQHSHQLAAAAGGDSRLACW